MMTDRELLEAAAKAAGIRLEWDGPPANWAPMYYEGKTYHGWNPLEDDGQALRLAVKLNLWAAVRDGHHHLDSDGDFYAATRRSIVRAAAALAPTP